jgi:outer membrane immunogenic protein
MKIQKLLLLTAASCLLSGAAAMADDGVLNWSGAYAGAIVDVNFGNTHYALPGDLNDVLLQDRKDHTSLAAGGVAGFNRQSGATVFGIEGDITSGNGTSSVTACTKVDGCFTSAHDSFTTLNHLKTDWSGRVRGRLGWTSGPMLFYAAAGYSFADTKLSLVGLCFDPANPTVPMVFNFARSHTLSGFNLGAGVERAVSENVSVRAEYLYEDFGHAYYAGEAPEWNDRRISVRNSAVRVAVAYHF